MKLSDVTAAAGETLFTEIALVIFVVTFALIVWRTLRKSSRREFELASRLPFVEDESGADR